MNYKLKLFFIIFIFFFIFNKEVFSSALTGSVEKEDYIRQKDNAVYDLSTGKPISNAVVGIPSKGIFTRTDTNGRFGLDVNLSGPSILSVQAEGYKPFSLTVGKDGQKPLSIGISKESKFEIAIDTEIHHLGDNNFSSDSANADDFQIQSSGPSFSKNFYIGTIDKNKNAVIKIGSIIGVDTDISRILGQNKILNSTSTPTSVYLNNKKIGEIKINGDEQELQIPQFSLTPNSYNVITIKTGRNKNTISYVDYDDIEFMNLIIEFK